MYHDDHNHETLPPGSAVSFTMATFGRIPLTIGNLVHV